MKDLKEYLSPKSSFKADKSILESKEEICFNWIYQFVKRKGRVNYFYKYAEALHEIVTYGEAFGEGHWDDFLEMCKINGGGENFLEEIFNAVKVKIIEFSFAYLDSIEEYSFQFDKNFDERAAQGYQTVIRTNGNPDIIDFYKDIILDDDYVIIDDDIFMKDDVSETASFYKVECENFERIKEVWESSSSGASSFEINGNKYLCSVVDGESGTFFDSSIFLAMLYENEVVSIDEDDLIKFSDFAEDRTEIFFEKILKKIDETKEVMF